MNSKQLTDTWVCILETSKSTYFPPLIKPSNPLVAPQGHCIKTNPPLWPGGPLESQFHTIHLSHSPQNHSLSEILVSLSPIPTSLAPPQGLYMCCALSLENPLSDLCPLTFWVSKYLDSASKHFCIPETELAGVEVMQVHSREVIPTWAGLPLTFRLLDNFTSLY